MSALAGSGTNFIRPAADWLPVPTGYCHLSAFVAVGGTSLLRRDRQPCCGMVLPVTGLALASIVWLAIWNMVTGGVTFQVSHYASYLLPAQALVFVAIVGEVLHAATTERTRFTVLATLLASALLPVLSVERLWQWEAAWRNGLVFWLVPISLFASAAIGLAGQYRLAALLATVLAGTADLDTRQIFQGADNPDYKPYYRAAIRLNEIRAPVWMAGGCISGTIASPSRPAILDVIIG